MTPLMLRQGTRTRPRRLRMAAMPRTRRAQVPPPPPPGTPPPPDTPSRVCRLHMARPAHSDHADHAAPGGPAVPPASGGHHPPTTHADHPGPTGQAGHADHAAHTGHAEEMFARPFWVSLALTIPVLIYSDLLQSLLGYTAPDFPGSHYLSLVLGSIIYWYGGWVFLDRRGRRAARRAPGMMTLVALAITTAYFYSLAITAGPGAGHAVLLGAGHPRDYHAAGPLAGDARRRQRPERAQRAGKAAARYRRAHRRRTAPSRSPWRAARRRPVLVRPGAQVPADGIVEEGRARSTRA